MREQCETRDPVQVHFALKSRGGLHCRPTAASRVGCTRWYQSTCPLIATTTSTHDSSSTIKKCWISPSAAARRQQPPSETAPEQFFRPLHASRIRFALTDCVRTVVRLSWQEIRGDTSATARGHQTDDPDYSCIAQARAARLSGFAEKFALRKALACFSSYVSCSDLSARCGNPVTTHSGVTMSFPESSWDDNDWSNGDWPDDWSDSDLSDATTPFDSEEMDSKYFDDARDPPWHLLSLGGNSRLNPNSRRWRRHVSPPPSILRLPKWCLHCGCTRSKFCPCPWRLFPILLYDQL